MAEATLSPYNPTWRDRIAAALAGDSRPGSARSNFAEGLMGSRGIGTTGMGLADLTPAGIPMAAQDAQRSARAGDPVGAITNAMAVIPAAKMPIRAAQQGIRAYHGSPHSFDSFDLSKIGTGEGAQAYGHGLYFAENEAVAKGYRDRLSSPTIDGTPVVQISGARAPSADDAFLASILAHEKTPENARFRLNRLDRLDLMERMDEMIQKGRLKPGGSMYEVNINANPERFLDWDKPLAQQPGHVQGVIKDLAAQMPAPLKGPAIRNRQAILAGDGSVPGDVLYNNLGGFRMPADTSNALREAGIPGIKYLDGGSRGTGEGSRNYVVFDDKLIDIVRKYGLGGLMMGGLGASALSGSQGAQPPQPPQM